MALYTWRNGARTAGVNADVAGLELERIRAQHGGQLSPPDVVHESRPAHAPLHPVFEWDDSTAAEQWRLTQARNIIRSVRVVTDGDDVESHTTPKYVSVRLDAEQYYQDASVAVQNVDEWDSAVRELELRLSALNRALDDLRRIAGQSTSPNAATVLSLAERALAMAANAIKAIAA